MRLIDTQTHLLLEPWKAAGKEYAILSHTWGDEEVIFQEWEQLYPSGAIKGQCPHVRPRGIDKKAGYFKVMQACEQAQRDGIRYLWCDTMCINKESSAELSEAINSMFNWYRDAKVCYVYLTDVSFSSRNMRNGVGPAHFNVPGWFAYAMERKQNDDVIEMKSRFMASRWWTRGWTLQELLAPQNVVFFTQDWTTLGHKRGIAQWISSMTRIHREALEDHTTIRNFSIAQRMSWAAERQTTVPEDIAYCLLGIFGINMPMLYGQGKAAFQKLQYEIIKGSDDQSIFAWTAQMNEASPWTGALAQSPRCFKDCGSIIRDPQLIREPYSHTNIGFKMRALMIRNHFTELSFIGLSCFLELKSGSPDRHSAVESGRRVRVWIPVRDRGIGGFYERCHTPQSHVYFQYSYTTSQIVESPNIFFCEFPYRNSRGEAVDYATQNVMSRTGITASIGFGSMGMISKAYKEIWHPPSFQIISIGSRGPSCLSHEVVISGSCCIVLSVTWDNYCNPSTQKHTTFRATGKHHLQKLVDLLEETKRHFEDASTLHQRIISINQDALWTGPNSDSPTIVVEDEPLHDAHGLFSIMVDIIFKEKPN